MGASDEHVAGGGGGGHGRGGHGRGGQCGLREKEAVGAPFSVQRNRLTEAVLNLKQNTNHLQKQNTNHLQKQKHKPFAKTKDKPSIHKKIGLLGSIVLMQLKDASSQKIYFHFDNGSKLLS